MDHIESIIPVSLGESLIGASWMVLCVNRQDVSCVKLLKRAELYRLMLIELG